MRDYRPLRTYQLSDLLVERIYRATRGFPVEERYGLQAQLRRAAVSVPSNIVEGSARRSEAEYVQFLHIALGSAVEVAYLARLSARLQMLAAADSDELVTGYEEVVRKLQRQIASLHAR